MSRADPQLLDATRRVLAEHGYGGATMERIAEAAGLSRVTLHRRGVGKDALLAELAEGAVERYRKAMWPLLTSSDPALHRLELALGVLCDCAEQEMDLLLAVRAQSDAVFHEDAPGERLTRTIFTEPLERLLHDGMAEGTVRALDAPETATVLFNMIGWTYIHLRTGHGWSPERAARSTVDLGLHGLLSRR